MSYQDAQPHAQSTKSLTVPSHPKTRTRFSCSGYANAKKMGVQHLSGTSPQVFPTLKILWQQLSN